MKYTDMKTGQKHYITKHLGPLQQLKAISLNNNRQRITWGAFVEINKKCIQIIFLIFRKNIIPLYLWENEFPSYSILSRDHPVYGIGQSEKTLQCNDISHWLSSYSEIVHWMGTILNLPLLARHYIIFLFLDSCMKPYEMQRHICFK